MERNLVIAHVVVSDAFAGVEKYVCDVAPELARRGHEVVVVGGAQDVMHRAIAGRGGGEVRLLAGSDPWSALRALRRVRRVDVVHAHMTKAELVCAADRLRRRRPVVTTRHFALDRGVPRLVDAGIRAGLAAEIAISEFVAATCRTTTDTVISGVPDGAAVDPVPRVVLVAQRLEAEKSTAEALHGWALAGLAAEGWSLAIAGVGQERNMLEDLARRLRISESVRFLGFVEDIAGLRASVGMQLATSTADGFGLSVTEAMAVALPVIAADGGAHPELLADTPELLYSPGDRSALAALLRRLASDVDARRTLGARLQQSQRARFSLTGHVDGLERVYQRVTR